LIVTASRQGITYDGHSRGGRRTPQAAKHGSRKMSLYAGFERESYEQ
jgi:hypothetical protein